MLIGTETAPRAIRSNDAALAAKCGITSQRVLQELAAVAYADLETNEQVTATAKVAALDKLAKHFGLYRQDEDEPPKRVEVRWLPPRTAITELVQ